MAAPIAIFARKIKEVARPVPLQCAPTTTCAELVVRFGETGADCALIVDADQKPAGIVTLGDIVRRVSFTLGPDTPLRQIMTTPVHVIAEQEPAYRALARIGLSGRERLVVVDAAGRSVGLVKLADLLALAAPRFLAQLDRMTCRPNLDRLREVKRAQASFADTLLADGLEAPAVQALISEINDDIHRHVVELALTAMREDGWGEPPVGYAVIVMGSGGRGESLLAPDQDNGLILEDYSDEEHTPIDRYFSELGQRMTRHLDDIGFPLCDGYVMATNPVWRKNLGQWKLQIEGWLRRRSGAALLHADIFFDFRVVHGESGLGSDLMRHAVALVARQRDFLHAMSANEGHHSVGLGWFDRLVTDREDAAHRGEINVKRSGILPIVEAVRLYALSRGVTEVSTGRRMASLHEDGAFSDDELDYLQAAFAFMSGLLLRQQVADLLGGGKASNYLAPESLSSRERDYLVNCLKASQDLARRARADFTGEIL